MNSRGTYYIILKIQKGKQHIMKIYKKEIAVYDFEGIFDGFCVEVDKSDEITDIYLYHKQCGIKRYMFGLYTKDEKEIRQIVASNIMDYINIYIDEYMRDCTYGFVDSEIA